MFSKITVLLFGLLILLLPSQLTFHFWPSYSFLGGFKIDYLSPALYLTDLLVLSIIVIFRPKIKISKLTALLFLLIFLNIIFSISPWVSLYKYFRLTIYLLLFVSLISKKNAFLSAVKNFWPYMLIWVSLLAIFQFLVKSSLGGFWYWLGERPLNLSQLNIAKISLGNLGLFLRSYSTFPHPNALAGFIVVGLVVISSLRLQISRILFYLSFTLGLLALLLTFSRTAFIAVILSNLIYGYRRLWSIFLLILIPPIVQIGSLVSVSDRLIQLTSTVFIITNHIFLGVGLGAYPIAAFLSQTPYPLFYLIYQPVHNLYLLLISEIGVFPFIIFSLIVAELLIKSKKYLTPPALFVLCFVVLTALNDHYWITSVQNSLLLFIISAYFITTSPYEENHH